MYVMYCIYRCTVPVLLYSPQAEYIENIFIANVIEDIKILR